MKIIVIRWKDGSETSMVVHEDTDVLAAYKLVLSHIKWIAELDHENKKAIPLYEDKEDEHL